MKFSGLLLVLAMLLSACASKENPDHLYQVKVDESRILFGPTNAPVTIIKYADFQCPACKMGFHSLEEIEKKYAGKVRIIHKNIPLEMHPQAVLAAEIFESLVITDKPKARQFYTLAYSTQGEWNSAADLWKMLKKVGGEQKKIEEEIKKGVVVKRINEDEVEHARLGFPGTPAYLINGVALYGAQSPERMSLIIEHFLKK